MNNLNSVLIEGVVTDYRQGEREVKIASQRWYRSGNTFKNKITVVPIRMDNDKLRSLVEHRLVKGTGVRVVGRLDDYIGSQGRVFYIDAEHIEVQKEYPIPEEKTLTEEECLDGEDVSAREGEE